LGEDEREFESQLHHEIEIIMSMSANGVALVGVPDPAEMERVFECEHVYCLKGCAAESNMGAKGGCCCSRILSYPTDIHVKRENGELSVWQASHAGARKDNGSY
jgi:hypothetical protein